ncbi:MAG: hypothetical protein U0X20_31225 [Caldilineaceae bacterium]
MGTAVLLTAAWGGQRLARAPIGEPAPATSPLAVAQASPLVPVTATTTQQDDIYQTISDPGNSIQIRIPAGWHAYAGSDGRISAANYDFMKIDQRPAGGIWMEFGLGELPFPQSFAEWWAARRQLETEPNDGPPPRIISDVQPITVGGLAGKSWVLNVPMEDGSWWPIQSIYLPVEDRWVASVVIKPVSAPDYAAAQQVFATLEITPHCDASTDLRAALETVVANELLARQTGNWRALASLMHPEASNRWREQQRYLLDPTLRAIDLTRIESANGLALAATIETYQEGQAPPSQIYTTRTFRQAPTGCWVLMSPDSSAWGVLRVLELDGIQVSFATFDEPYVRAVAPRLNVLLPKVARDFGVLLDANRELVVRVTPPFEAAADLSWAGVPWTMRVASPLSPGFPIGSAQAPEEYLLAELVDGLGHMLLEATFGEKAQEPARLALAHTAVQWEVEQALQRDTTPQLAAQVGTVITPLDELLDPTRFVATGSAPAERDLFLRFVVTTYGRERIAPYLRAVFSAVNAGELVTGAFNEKLEAVELKWHVWLEKQVAAVGRER